MLVIFYTYIIVVLPTDIMISLLLDAFNTLLKRINESNNNVIENNKALQ